MSQPPARVGTYAGRLALRGEPLRKAESDAAGAFDGPGPVSPGPREEPVQPCVGWSLQLSVNACVSNLPCIVAVRGL